MVLPSNLTDREYDKFGTNPSGQTVFFVHSVTGSSALTGALTDREQAKFISDTLGSTAIRIIYTSE